LSWVCGVNAQILKLVNAWTGRVAIKNVSLTERKNKLPHHVYHWRFDHDELFHTQQALSNLCLKCLPCCWLRGIARAGAGGPPGKILAPPPRQNVLYKKGNPWLYSFMLSIMQMLFAEHSLKHIPFLTLIISICI
jgi:hypothetical protein